MTWVHVEDHGSVCADPAPGQDQASGLMYCAEGLQVSTLEDAVSGFAPPPSTGPPPSVFGLDPPPVPARPAARFMFRYVVQVDDREHELALTGDPVAVATADPFGTAVEFWAEHDGEARPVPRTFRVFGTGHTLPPGARWRGTCPRTSSGLVWHLYETGPKS